MTRQKTGRIVNFSSVAAPLDLERRGSLRRKQERDRIPDTHCRKRARSIRDYRECHRPANRNRPNQNGPQRKYRLLVSRQPIKRLGRFEDVVNCIDFFLKPESEFITGQTLYLGGIS